MVQRWRLRGRTVQFEGATLEVRRSNGAVRRCRDGGQEVQRSSSKVRRWRFKSGTMQFETATLKLGDERVEVGAATIEITKGT
jgi:hypothetical protein